MVLEIRIVTGRTPSGQVEDKLTELVQENAAVFSERVAVQLEGTEKFLGRLHIGAPNWTQLINVKDDDYALQIINITWVSFSQP